MRLKQIHETLATGAASYSYDGANTIKPESAWMDQQTNAKQKEDKGSSAPGTFAGVNFDSATLGALAAYMRAQNIPNPVPVDKLHTTLLYSKRNLPNFLPQEKYDSPYTANSNGLEVFEPRADSEKQKRCLVLKLDCDELSQRHSDLMIDHNADYDFDEYIPHVTLSYDVGDAEPKDFEAFDRPLNITGEYHEELND